jgi:hypothetical protein
MEEIKRLLRAEERSEVARMARGGIVALHALLHDAVRRNPDDVELVTAIGLIGQLDELLGGASGEAKAAGAAADADLTDTRLDDLVRKFTADQAVRQLVDEQSLTALTAAGSVDESWLRLHLCVLRLAAPVAARWRTRIAALAAPADRAALTWRILPGEEETILVLPYVRADQSSGGWQISPGAPVDAEVAEAIGLHSAGTAGDAEAAILARLSTLVLGLAELDDALVLCLQDVLYTGSRRLTDELRQSYRTDLLGRLHEYARSETGSTGRLRALLDIDEAVNSLTHRPPPPSNSWWAQLRQRSRQLAVRAADELARAGTDVEVMPIGLRYLEARDLTEGNDVRSSVGGEPGDVLACLRMWARVEGKTLPGRVIYRA